MDEDENGVIEVCGIRVLPGLIETGSGWIVAAHVDRIKNDGTNRTIVWLADNGNDDPSPITYYKKCGVDVAKAVSRALVMLYRG